MFYNIFQSQEETTHLPLLVDVNFSELEEASETIVQSPHCTDEET